MTVRPAGEPLTDLRKIVSEEVLRHRILENIVEGEKPTFWRGLLAAPLTSVLVAGVLGAWLTHQYDTQRLRTENELIKSRAVSDRLATQRENEISHAFATFEDVSRLLDKRLWRARSVVWSTRDGADSAEMVKRRLEYRDAVKEWNENLNRNLALVEKYFGLQQRGYLEVEISDGLRVVNSELRNKKFSEKQLTERINELNGKIYVFDVGLLQMLQTGNVGMFRGRS